MLIVRPPVEVLTPSTNFRDWFKSHAPKGATEWGIVQANRYTDDLTAAFAQLAANPQRGVACDHIRKSYRRRSVGRHVIYFRVAGYGIAIIRVLHGRTKASVGDGGGRDHGALKFRRLRSLRTSIFLTRFYGEVPPACPA